MSQQWYKIENEDAIDSPSLLIYRERVARNIAQMIASAGGCHRLMVHVKTNKMPEVVKMMLDAGISRFKCATIAEAEMVCMASGKDMLIAHQLLGPKIGRLLKLRTLYPHAAISSLVDCQEVASELNAAFADTGMVAQVLLDVNNGMNRSGHPLNEKILPLYQYLHQLPNLQCLGLHVYDGHLRESDSKLRKAAIQKDFEGVEDLISAITAQGLPRPMLVAGGTPSFSSHVLRTEAYCSPGTCVLWDWGYDEKAERAAIRICCPGAYAHYFKACPGGYYHRSGAQSRSGRKSHSSAGTFSEPRKVRAFKPE